MNLSEVTSETLAKAADLIKNLRKAGETITTSTGLVPYNLEAPAKLLVPMLSDFRQYVGRKVYGGTGTNWRAITSVTPSGAFKATEGTKANGLAIAKTDYSTSFLPYGRLGNVTWEAQKAGKGYEDARARAESLTLLSFLKEEEGVILGGSTSSLAAPTGLAVSPSAGGSIPAAAYNIRVAALSLEGVYRASKVSYPAMGTNDYDLSNPGTLDNASANPIGAGLACAQVAGTTASSNLSLTCTWNAVAGAAGYAIYVDNHYCGTVTQTKAVIKAIPTSNTGQAVPASDKSDASPFKGIIGQLLTAGSGAYTKNLAATLGTATGNQILPIADMITDIYARTRGVEPDRLVMGWPEAGAIDRILSSVTNDRINIVYNAGEGGVQFKKMGFYPSPVSGKQIKIEVVPNLPGGMILGLIDSVPIPDAEIPSPWQLHMASDVERIDYAVVAPVEEFEVRAYGALAGYAPALQGIIYNVWQG